MLRATRLPSASLCRYCRVSRSPGEVLGDRQRAGQHAAPLLAVRPRCRVAAVGRRPDSGYSARGLADPPAVTVVAVAGETGDRPQPVRRIPAVAAAVAADRVAGGVVAVADLQGPGRILDPRQPVGRVIAIAVLPAPLVGA